MLYSAVQYSIVEYSTVQYSTQCCTVQQSGVPLTVLFHSLQYCPVLFIFSVQTIFVLPIPALRYCRERRGEERRGREKWREERRGEVRTRKYSRKGGEYKVGVRWYDVRRVRGGGGGLVGRWRRWKGREGSGEGATRNEGKKEEWIEQNRRVYECPHTIFNTTNEPQIISKWINAYVR
jgi:hypothetical protein